MAGQVGQSFVCVVLPLIKMKELIYLHNVVTLALDEEKCTGCGLCLFVCPHAVLSMNDKHARIENRDACMECGACARNCPAEAVTVESGVGCATAVINTALGRSSSSCCCVIEPKDTSATPCVTSRKSDQCGCC